MSELTFPLKTTSSIKEARALQVIRLALYQISSRKIISMLTITTAAYLAASEAMLRYIEDLGDSEQSTLSEGQVD